MAIRLEHKVGAIGGLSAFATGVGKAQERKKKYRTDLMLTQQARADKYGLTMQQHEWDLDKEERGMTAAKHAAAAKVTADKDAAAARVTADKDAAEITATADSQKSMSRFAGTRIDSQTSALGRLHGKLNVAQMQQGQDLLSAIRAFGSPDTDWTNTEIQDAFKVANAAFDTFLRDNVQEPKTPKDLFDEGTYETGGVVYGVDDSGKGVRVLREPVDTVSKRKGEIDKLYRKNLEKRNPLNPEKPFYENDKEAWDAANEFYKRVEKGNAFYDDENPSAPAGDRTSAQEPTTEDQPFAPGTEAWTRAETQAHLLLKDAGFDFNDYRDARKTLETLASKYGMEATGTDVEIENLSPEEQEAWKKAKQILDIVKSAEPRDVVHDVPPGFSIKDLSSPKTDRDRHGYPLSSGPRSVSMHGNAPLSSTPTVPQGMSKADAQAWIQGQSPPLPGKAVPGGQDPVPEENLVANMFSDAAGFQPDPSKAISREEEYSPRERTPTDPTRGQDPVTEEEWRKLVDPTKAAAEDEVADSKTGQATHEDMRKRAEKQKLRGSYTSDPRKWKKTSELRAEADDMRQSRREAFKAKVADRKKVSRLKKAGYSVKQYESAVRTKDELTESYPNIESGGDVPMKVRRAYQKIKQIIKIGKG